MGQQLSNKIEANDTNINVLLKGQKFTIDYFQREYRWQEKHIKILVEDLTTTFLKSYYTGDKRSEVSNYQGYYLGPVVFSINPDNGKKSIIDGQQRITSITLFLIYLNLLQIRNKQDIVSISELIFSEKYGEKSFNMTDEAREPCLKSLFETGEYELKDNDDQTVQNIVERYADIEQSFPEELTQNALPFFIDWFIENVIIVEIIAYSDENAYTVFETMNDRGLNLTQTEMLKGYVLSRITDKKQRDEINLVWKDNIQRLHDNNENSDLNFFQAWFRAKYAVSIRPGKVGAENQDFELIGSKFHSWFKENHKELFNLDKSEEFYDFFKSQLPFFVDCYLEIYKAQTQFNMYMPHAYYINIWGIAESLQEPLLLSSIVYGDNPKIIEKKIDFVSRYVETFTVRRAVNYRKFGQTSIKYTMFNIIKLVRNNDVSELGNNLTKQIEGITESWTNISDLRLHGQNKKFVKHLLSRISSYIDNLIGKDSTYVTYYKPIGKPFEIEHVWADKYAEHKDEFDQEIEFNRWRNYIGGLILLPQGTNQSYNSDRYEDKIEHYLKDNTYVQTLNENFYKKNPNFLKNEVIQILRFKAHPKFQKTDLKERQELVQRICERLWSTSYYT